MAAETIQMTIPVPGYERLAKVLCAAAEQASEGKGKERHANDLPFDKQPMQTIAADHGVGFITGQARKKMEEALGMLGRSEHAATIKELLGAINYVAGAVIYVQDRQPVKLTEFEQEQEGDGWKVWSGCGWPSLSHHDELVDVRLRGGAEISALEATRILWHWADQNSPLHGGDVVFYRKTKAGQ